MYNNILLLISREDLLAIERIPNVNKVSTNKEVMRVVKVISKNLKQLS